MEISKYQALAKSTDQNPCIRQHDLTEKGILIPLLGLVGEAGSLLTECKKRLRVGEAHTLFREHVTEEIGDLLWYLADIATKFDISLESAAILNLQKCEERWPAAGQGATSPRFFDEHLDVSEQIPREFYVRFSEVPDTSGKIKMLLTDEAGRQVGSQLTDNAYDDDGYRFHDAFHLAYAAILAWSPVTRAFFRRKRKSQPLIDEVEDGGRAAVIEEGIAALVYAHAKNHGLFATTGSIDYDVFRTIKSMTSHLEVKVRATHEWKSAILQGYTVWHQLRKNRGGLVQCNLNKGEISYIT